MTQHILARQARQALGLIALMALGACADTVALFGVPEGAVRGASNGTHLGYWLKASDREALTTALAAALGSPDAGAPHRWHNPRTGASGTLVAMPAFFTALEAMGGRPIEAPVGLVSTVPLLADGRVYATTANSNVRQGPSTGAGLIATLPKGTSVTVLGVTAKSEGWALIARGDQVLGYVYAPLLAPQAEQETQVLAGGEAQLPMLCRRFTSEVQLPEGRGDQWEGTACRERDGQWAVKTVLPGD